MIINFDTESVNLAHVRGLIAFLSTLLPVNEQTPAQSAPVPPPPPPPPTQAPPSAEPSPTTTTEPATEQTTKRTRRTRAEMEAAANPTQGSAAAPAAVSGTTQAAPAQPSTAAATQPKPIDADTLRGLLNAHIAKHSMEEAIAILQSFGCNRVTEALALDPAKLNELAEKLNG